MKAARNCSTTSTDSPENELINARQSIQFNPEEIENELRERLCCRKTRYRRRWKDWPCYPIPTETDYSSCSMCSQWNRFSGDRSQRFRLHFRRSPPASGGTSRCCGPKKRPTCSVRCCKTVRRPRDRRAPSERWTSARIQDRRRSCTSWPHLAAVWSEISPNFPPLPHPFVTSRKHNVNSLNSRPERGLRILCGVCRSWRVRLRPYLEWPYRSSSNPSGMFQDKEWYRGLSAVIHTPANKTARSNIINQLAIVTQIIQYQR